MKFTAFAFTALTFSTVGVAATMHSSSTEGATIDRPHRLDANDKEVFLESNKSSDDFKDCKKDCIDTECSSDSSDFNQCKSSCKRSCSTEASASASKDTGNGLLLDDGDAKLKTLSSRRNLRA
mmetsp:Transcript_10317/g.22404  ORF Transcript_10317/g.22404 Transcript_10317/m.22404 type:complete len:123 (+) Transcript_10317:533-901(+)